MELGELLWVLLWVALVQLWHGLGYSLQEVLFPGPIQLYYNKASKLLPGILRRCPSLHPSSRFRPTPWLLSPHLQTGWFLKDKSPPKVEYERELLRTSDGGVSALDWGKEATYQQQPPISRRPPGEQQQAVLIIVPGLTGDSTSRYIRHTVGSAMARGWQAVVLNHRGTADVGITSPYVYNAGFTGDLRAGVDLAGKKYPGAALLVGGFSLGANVVARYLAEEGPATQVAGAFSFCNPFDFITCDHHMMTARMCRLIYNPFLTRNLKRSTAKQDLQALPPRVDYQGVLTARSVRDFDRAFTRPMFNYETTDDYYRDASSGPLIRKIETPMLCLNTVDDPLVPAIGLPYEEAQLTPNTVLVLTPAGGHVAHFTGWRARVWWTKPIFEFLAAAASPNDSSQHTGLQNGYHQHTE